VSHLALPVIASAVASPRLRLLRLHLAVADQLGRQQSAGQSGLNAISDGGREWVRPLAHRLVGAPDAVRSESYCAAE
jgi:hypothetical protein